MAYQEATLRPESVGPEAVAVNRPRIESIDVVRGVIVILMALADRLSDLDFRRGDALSVVPLVCGIEAPPQRCVELFLSQRKSSIQDFSFGARRQSLTGRSQHQAGCAFTNLHQIRNRSLRVKLRGLPQ